MARHIKKGDMVMIISGDHKGSTGKVLKVNVDKQCAVVQGQNLVKKHVRPSQKNPQGGRINIEQPIHISKLLPVHPKTGQGTRVRFKINEDGSKKRICLDGTEIDVVRKAK